jgi:hypothetical protein
MLADRITRLHFFAHVWTETALALVSGLLVGAGFATWVGG